MGLIIFQGLVKIKLFPWASIVKISFKRKQFFLQQKREQVRFVERKVQSGRSEWTVLDAVKYLCTCECQFPLTVRSVDGKM